jgi:uncharacterized damage-inducible protein DinB
MAETVSPSHQERFLEVYEQEHARTMKVLRAYPPDKAELRPHPRCKTARELAWIFVLERGLGTVGMQNVFAGRGPSGKAPEPPETWDEVIAALEKAHVEFADVVRSYTPEQFQEPIKFFVGPGQLGDFTREDFAWFLLHDQIHHRGQLSIYLRLADAKVPSIYGPSGDEPWF